MHQPSQARSDEYRVCKDNHQTLQLGSIATGAERTKVGGLNGSSYRYRSPVEHDTHSAGSW